MRQQKNYSCKQETYCNYLNYSIRRKKKNDDEINIRIIDHVGLEQFISWAANPFYMQQCTFDLCNHHQMETTFQMSGH